MKKIPHWKEINSKHYFLLFVAVFTLLLAGIPSAYRCLHPTDTGLLKGEFEKRESGFWDLYDFPDDPDCYHCLQLMNGELSVVIRKIASAATMRRLVLHKFRSKLEPDSTVKFVSANFCTPYDVDGDGDLEGIINANDSTATYLIAYEKSGEFREIYSQAWDNPNPGQLWRAFFNVLGLVTVRNSKHLILELDRSIHGGSSKLIDINLATNDARNIIDLEAGIYRAGFFHKELSSEPGFYFTTHGGTQIQSKSPMPTDTSYLFVFKHDGTQWTRQIVYHRFVQFNKGICAQPFSHDGGIAWAIAVTTKCYLIDEYGGAISDTLESEHGGYIIEDIIDSVNDRQPDRILLSNYQEIIEVRFDGAGRLKVEASFDSKERFNFFEGHRLKVHQPTSFDRALLLVHTNRGTLFFLDHRLQPVGMLNLPVVFGYGFLKTSGHFKRQRLFVKSEKSLPDYILLSGGGQEGILFVEPIFATSSMAEKAGVAVYYFAVIFISILAFTFLKKSDAAQSRIRESDELFKKTIKIFRKKPSDVTLYMDCLYSNEWAEIQRRVKEGTTDVLNSLQLANPHDSIREEVGLPMAGTERLVNLLILRRVTLHFIAQGLTGIPLLRKLNFQIDQRYLQLMKEARVILKRVFEKLKSEARNALSEVEMNDIIRELEAQKQIYDAPEPRKVFAEIERNSDDSITGKIRLTQAGREIKLTVKQNQISPDYHSKLSPSFTNFMSVIGLSPDEPQSNQPVFSEEVDYLTSLKLES